MVVILHYEADTVVVVKGLKEASVRTILSQ